MLTQTKKIVTAISLIVAGLGGILLIVIGVFLAFFVASGGLYTNGSLSDATTTELAIGVCMLALSCLPLALVLFFTVFWWRSLRRPSWATVIGWVSVVCILGGVFLEYLSVGLQHGGFRYESMGWGMYSLPVLPFTLGLLVFLSCSDRSRDH